MSYGKDKMPFCKGVDCIARNGRRYNKNGKKQRWKCTKFDKRFTEDGGFWKMKNTPETIVEAIDLLHLKDIIDNFARRRNRKSKTPAELAGINLDLGRNKTLGLIYLLLI